MPVHTEGDFRRLSGLRYASTAPPLVAVAMAEGDVAAAATMGRLSITTCLVLILQGVEP